MKYTKVGKVLSPKGIRKNDAGIDLFIAEDWNNGQDYKLYFGEQINIPSQIKFDIPEGIALQIENKSSISTKLGTTRGATTCDHSYCGIVHINLHKGVIGTEDLYDDENGITHRFDELKTHEERKKHLYDAYAIIKPNMKIAQAIMFKISDEEIKEITNEEYDLVKTDRGDRGFGEGTGQN